MRRCWTVRVIAACVAIAALGRLGVPVALAEDAGESPGATAAYTAASIPLSIVQGPSTFAMCSISVVLGGFAYLLTWGRGPVAKDVGDTIKGVCSGPWVFTPEQVRNDMDPNGAQ